MRVIVDERKIYMYKNYRVEINNLFLFDFQFKTNKISRHLKYYSRI